VKDGGVICQLGHLIFDRLHAPPLHIYASSNKKIVLYCAITTFEDMLLGLQLKETEVLLAMELFFLLSAHLWIVLSPYCP
jgi:hypothetical protein